MPRFASTDGPKSDIPVDGHNRYKIPRYPFASPFEAGSVPVEGTGMLVPWTRVSTILDTHEDKEGIFKWTKRLVVKGLGAREDLYALAAATRLEDKSTLLRVANQAFDYAKGQAASNLGSALHGFLERWVEGDPTLVIPSQWKGDVGAVMAAFQAANIRLRPDLQEMVVVRPDLKDGDAGGLAGRFDLVVEMLNPETGEWELIVADYKTGSDPLAYGSWKIQQQLGLYGTGWAVWDGTHWHPMPTIRRDKILMVHVLPGQASVQIHIGDVDPVELEDDLAAAYRTRRRRKEAKKAWRPLVTVEDGAVIVDTPIGEMVKVEIGQGEGATLRTDGTIAVGPLKPTHQPYRDGNTEQVIPTEEHAATIIANSYRPKTADQVEQERLRDERLARIQTESNPNQDGDDEAEQAHVPAGHKPYPTGGDGTPLMPLAGPGERGCGVCGRKGHRRGSPKCLGLQDPYASAATPTPAPQENPDASAVEPSTPAPSTMESLQSHPAGGHQWTLDQESQTWVCAIGGESAAPEQAPAIEQDERDAEDARVEAETPNLTLEDHARAILSDARDREDDDTRSTGDAAVLSGDEAEIRKWWTPNSDPDDETTEADLAAALLAGEMVRAERLTEPDPFDEDGSTALTPAPLSWLDQVQNATSKADLRAIRSDAMVIGQWTAELTAAGLERMKSFPSVG